MRCWALTVIRRRPSGRLFFSPGQMTSAPRYPSISGDRQTSQSGERVFHRRDALIFKGCSCAGQTSSARLATIQQKAVWKRRSPARDSRRGCARSASLPSTVSRVHTYRHARRASPVNTGSGGDRRNLAVGARRPQGCWVTWRPNSTQPSSGPDVTSSQQARPGHVELDRPLWPLGWRIRIFCYCATHGATLVDESGEKNRACSV